MTVTKLIFKGTVIKTLINQPVLPKLKIAVHEYIPPTPDFPKDIKQYNMVFQLFGSELDTITRELVVSYDFSGIEEIINGKKNTSK